jgi:hypothetical protein
MSRRPQMARILRSEALSGPAPRLAGDAAGKDGGPPNSSLEKSVCCEGSQVIVNVDLRPVTGQDAPAIWLYLAKGDCLEPGDMGRNPKTADS